MLNINREQFAWAAGLYEGEGSAHLRVQPRFFGLSVTSTDEDVLRKLRRVLGVGNVTGPYTSKNPHHKAFYRWSTTTFEHAQFAAAALWPHLCVRRQGQIHRALTGYLALTRDPRRTQRTTPPRREMPVRVARIRELSAQGAMSQAAIAREIGMTQSAVSMILSGKRCGGVQ